MVSVKTTRFLPAVAVFVFAASTLLAQPAAQANRSSELFRQATEAYRANRFDAAISNYTEYLKLRPDSPNGWYNRGLAYREKAEAAMSRPDFEKAEADISQAIKIDPKDADYWIYRGLVRLRLVPVDFKNKVAGGISDFTEAIRLAPNSARAYSGRGQIYAEANDTTKALADLDRALQLDKGDYVAYFTRAKLLELTKDRVGARADLETAIRLYPGYDAAKNYLAYINGAAAKTGLPQPSANVAMPVASMSDGYKRTEDAEKTGNHNLVVQLATQTIQTIPMRAAGEPVDDLVTSIYINLLRKRAKAYANLGKLADSDADYQAAVMSAMNNTTRHMRSANAELAKDKSGMAGGDIMASLEAAKGVIICRSGMDIGQEWIAAVDRTRPKDLGVGLTAGISMAGIRELCSIAHMAQGGYQALRAVGKPTVDRQKILGEAIESYSEAVKLTPRDSQPYAERAKLYRQIGRADLAAADDRKVAELPPRKT